MNPSQRHAMIEDSNTGVTFEILITTYSLRLQGQNLQYSCCSVICIESPDGAASHSPRKVLTAD